MHHPITVITVRLDGLDSLDSASPVMVGEASIKGSCLKDCDLFMAFSEWVMENVMENVS